LKPAFRIFASESGASAVELGVILTVFLSMLFGIINVAMVLWTQGSLHYATEKAARCAAVASTSCDTTTLIQTYALNQYYGLSLGGTNPFVYSATGCGHTVTASYTYSLAIPLVGTYSLPLAATACSP
jgi:Flp pilus assembly protein TadG